MNKQMVEKLAENYQTAQQNLNRATREIQDFLDQLAFAGNKESLIELCNAITMLASFPLKTKDLASKVASSYNLESVNDVALNHPQIAHIPLRWFFTLVAQEFLIRGINPYSSILKKLHDENSLKYGACLPFNTLPLSLYNFEHDLQLINYGTNPKGYSYSVPSPSTTQDDKQFETIKKRDIQISYTYLERIGELDKIRSVIKDWEEMSNGISEIKIVQFEESILPDRIPEILGALNLHSIPKETVEYDVRKISLHTVFKHLFSAAYSGGAYSGGNLGAIGRVKAWESLIGLTGLESSDTFDKIAQTANECTWWSYWKTPWFYDVAWDITVVCLRPDGKTVSILAATDQD